MGGVGGGVVRGEEGEGVGWGEEEIGMGGVEGGKVGSY